MKKINIFKISLILVTFFNCLFFSMEDSFAITQSNTTGAKDRVRKFDDLDFTYSPEEGFSCRPGGLKYMAFNKSGLGEAFDKGVGATYYVVINLLFFPILCSQLLTLFNSVKGGGFRSFLILLIAVFGFKTLEYVEKLIYDEDDFNLDPYNPYCLAITIPMLVACIAIMIVAQIQSIQLGQKILIIISISFKANIIKEAFKAIQYAIASKVFDKFELCGDNWLNYGDEKIEEKLNGVSVSSSWDNWKLHFSNAYPSRGAFHGSYKYMVNKCFIENDMSYCKILYNDQGLSTETLTTKTNLMYKQYREYYYDGKEFAYAGCNDPRPDRKIYFGTIDKTSQLYYFKGIEPANFACDRFLISSSKEYREAYKCCLETSQKTVCINNTQEKRHVMCNKDYNGGICEFKYKTNIFDYFSIKDKDKYNEQSKSDTKEICTNLKENITNSCNDINSEECKGAKDSYNDICDASGSIKPEVLKDANGKSVIDISAEAEDAKLFKDYSIKFKIKQIADSKGVKYCVETYNLCPYNFKILGGTEQYGTEFSMINDGTFEVEDNCTDKCEQKNPNEFDKKFNAKNNCTFDKDGNRHCDGPCLVGETFYACYNKPSNFCQIDRHCTYVQPLVEVENNNLSPYIDRACIDGIGFSHNFLNYERPLAKTTKNQKNLITPLVECTVETFKNILLNRAGHTICSNLDDEIIGDECLNSEAIMKQGDNLSKSEYKDKYKSPFLKIRNYLKNVIKAILALSVVLYGYNIILFRKGTTPEEILKYILTITLVFYFSFNTRWIEIVFDNVYGIYNRVAEFAVEIITNDKEEKEKYSVNNPKYSGCFFLKGDYIKNNYESYRDRKYIAVFDTFDCKLSRYFGYYTDNIGNPPIISIFIMGIFTAGLSILTMLPFILMFVSLLFFVVRIAYVFITNSLTLTILLFMTPIFVPMVLFERTKGFFNSWIKKIIRNIMSPLFIFMALSLFFVIFDKYFVADAIFYGANEPIRSVYCDTICKISENNYFHIDNDEQKKICNESKGKVIDLKKSAPICAVQSSGISNKTGIGLLDFILEDFPGLPGLPNFSGITDQIAGFFNMFFDLIFLLILIFIFEQFISYVNAMTGIIFSSDGANPSGGIDDDASGLPSLQKITNMVGSAGAKMANASFDVARTGIGKGIDKIKGKDNGNDTETIKDSFNRPNPVSSSKKEN